MVYEKTFDTFANVRHENLANVYSNEMFSLRLKIENVCQIGLQTFGKR